VFHVKVEELKHTELPSRQTLGESLATFVGQLSRQWRGTCWWSLIRRDVSMYYELVFSRSDLCSQTQNVVVVVVGTDVSTIVVMKQTYLGFLAF